jgi:hypothetical protein
VGELCGLSIYLWLDDERKPPSVIDSGIPWTWAKTADEAIEYLKTSEVVFASLDHDLADEHYFENAKAHQEGRLLNTSGCKEKTGMSVINWMEEQNVWPRQGVRVHTLNAQGQDRMLSVVNKIYGRRFQYHFNGVADGVSGTDL